MSRDTSRVLALAFSDLVDSTALKTLHGDAAVDRLLQRHREHVARLAQDGEGRVIDWAGDGCFLTFETSSAAILFALRLQQAHAEELDLPAVRVGVHVGDVTEGLAPDGAPHVKGLSVDIAARVSSLAGPGQVLMTASVYDSARQRIDANSFDQPLCWQMHGAYEIKGLERPLEIGSVALEGSTSVELPKASETAQRPEANNLLLFFKDCELDGARFEGVVGKPTWRPGLALLSVVCAALGDEARAELLYDLLKPYRGEAMMIGTIQACLGPTSLYLGMLAGTVGRWQEADALFEEALCECDALDSPPWRARTQLASARIWLARGRTGDRERAQDLLVSALETAEELGVVRVGREIGLLKTQLELS